MTSEALAKARKTLAAVTHGLSPHRRPFASRLEDAIRAITRDEIERAAAPLVTPNAYPLAECADHPGETEWPDSGCAKCREESA